MLTWGHSLQHRLTKGARDFFIVSNGVRRRTVGPAWRRGAGPPRRAPAGRTRCAGGARRRTPGSASDRARRTRHSRPGSRTCPATSQTQSRMTPFPLACPVSLGGNGIMQELGVWVRLTVIEAMTQRSVCTLLALKARCITASDCPLCQVKVSEVRMDSLLSCK